MTNIILLTDCTQTTKSFKNLYILFAFYLHCLLLIEQIFNILKNRSDFYLKYIVGAPITVPELSIALVSQTELKFVPDLQVGEGGQLEAELVGVALAAAQDVLPVSLHDRPPVVHRPPHRHRLVEGDVQDSNNAKHCRRTFHEGVF